MIEVREAQVSRGVVERRYDIETADGLLPCVVWTPEGADGQRPLVLMGHGGTQHKRAPYVLGLARRFVRHLGFAVGAIDAVGHGARRAGEPGVGTGDPSDGDALLSAMPPVFNEESIDRMCADWAVALAEVRALPEVGTGPLGYWGLSLGTFFGVPLVALMPEIKVAVLGLMAAFRPYKDRLLADAARVACPVLFVLQTDDELVPFDRGLGLFAALGTSDKRLHAHTGKHNAVPAEEAVAMEDFLARHLAVG